MSTINGRTTLGFMGAMLAMSMAAAPPHGAMVIFDPEEHERQLRQEELQRKRRKQLEKERLKAMPERLRRSPEESKQRLSAAEAKRQRRAERNKAIMERTK